MNNHQFISIERYPHRTPLDISNVISKYTRDKIVCDIGCGAGDILEFLKLNNLCKDVIGIETNSIRHEETRKYITHADIFDIPLPDADVYLLWFGETFSIQ